MTGKLRTITALLSGIGLLIFAFPHRAAAHALGARYDLPLPIEYYLAGAGAAVALSFVMMVIAFDMKEVRAQGRWIGIARLGPLKSLAHPWSVLAFRTLSTGLFLLIIAAGYLGTQDPVKNFAPTFIWITWWVGLAYVAALVGNVWPVINPWSALFDGAEKCARLSGWKGAIDFGCRYPNWLGVWPAIVLFTAFAWFELINESAKTPATLATAISIYSGITWAGMIVFGRDKWLSHGEAFSLAFNVFGRFAPFGPRPEYRSSEETEEQTASQATAKPTWGLRPYASDLITTTPCRLTVTFFILTMLSTVTFDGFKETPFWGDMLQSVALTPFFHPLIRLIHDLGFNYFVILETIVLVLFPVVFALVYLGFCWLTKIVAGCDQSVSHIAGLFIFSLVPIAIAYHLAHYLSYLLTAGQNIIPLASDPFGFGWNLFGTAGYKTDIGVVGARFIWYTAVIAIVAGHVFAVGVSHFVALRVFDPVRIALRTQYPLLVLMVGYTMVSLWILSQPIVGSPSLNTLSLKDDTVTLSPFEFRELCLSMKKDQNLEIEFQSDQPIEYDIHYHDGFAIRFPVKLKDVRDHRRRFTAENNRAYCLMWFNGGLKETTLRYRVTGP